jgi:hypothetical protein
MECPYHDPEDAEGCHAEELFADALALIKEQKEMIKPSRNIKAIADAINKMLKYVPGKPVPMTLVPEVAKELADYLMQKGADK